MVYSSLTFPSVIVGPGPLVEKKASAEARVEDLVKVYVRCNVGNVRQAKTGGHVAEHLERARENVSVVERMGANCDDVSVIYAARGEKGGGGVVGKCR